MGSVYRKLAIILVVLLGSGGVAVSGGPGTGQWLLESCGGVHGSEGRAFCMGYSMSMADLMLGQRKICMSTGVTSEQIRATVEDYLKAHPDKLQQHPVLLVIQALESKFPCR